MALVYHKFRKISVETDTEILILGTFAPDVPDEPDFYYGRSRNFLWHLLPVCWKQESLKDAPLDQKLRFMQQYKIGFADLIHSLEVPDGEEKNTDDTFVDTHVAEWNNVIALIEGLPQLKAVYFTRKTFNGIPNIKNQMIEIARHCQLKGLRVCKLETPARHFSVEKQQQWVDTIVLQKTCLRV